MYVESILKTLAACMALLVIILVYRAGIKQFVKQEAAKLWVAAGIFTLFNLVLIGFNQVIVIEDTAVRYVDSVVLELLWWISLYYLTNQIIQYWIWEKLYIQKGIVFSRVFHDMVSMLVLLFIITGVIYFVFNKSVFGIFTASGVLVIIIAYSAQSFLGDVFSGLELNVSKEFVVGDWIKVNDHIGKVVQINWHFVKLVTKEHNTLSFANSIITKLPITNLSRPTPMRGIVVNIPVHDETSPAEFKEILLTAASQSTKILKNPPPEASLVRFQEHDNLYQLFYHTHEMEEYAVSDEVLSIVWYMCRRKNIRTSTNDYIPVTMPTLAQIIAFLKQTDLFSKLKKDELGQLAISALSQLYGPPERLLEQGQANTSLFLIYKGSVDIVLANEEAGPLYVATLGPGHYFGEMSLLTGEPCNASVYLREEGIIIEITHEAMASLFAKKPELVTTISKEVIQRKEQNEALQASYARHEAEPSKTLIDRMVEQVKSFFKNKT